MKLIESGRFEPAADGSVNYVEQLRVPMLSFGTYSVPAGEADAQTPHSRTRSTWW